MESVNYNAAMAVEFDRQGNMEAAAYYYLQTVALMGHAVSSGISDESIFREKAGQYRARADTLQRELNDRAIAAAKKATAASGDLERAKFLLYEALEHDENHRPQEAVELYTEAVELCLTAKNSSKDDQLKSNLAKVARQALERAEKIKGINEEAAKVQQTTLAAKPTLLMRPLGIDGLNLNESNSSSTSSTSGGGGYSEEEKKVLAKTSLVNGREYVPFMSVDLAERFSSPLPFSDKHGKLALAPKQKSKLERWARPDEFMSNPCVLHTVDCFSVKQTVVSDCSFVASIAISAQYEKRFKKRLITSIIYPQNRAGDPVYNPCGKYMVKLRINGVPRKIIIDDYFPLGPHREPLCSYSSNRNELWISILEKAYMKVMGGYDFPGSNSNIDLYALTGWIPERASIKNDDPTGFNKEGIFRKLLERFHKGDVLVTLATGEMSDAEADRAGLVPTHAYAMLDIREVNGVKLFMLKNPWSHLRWKGNYSELDNRNWTPDKMTALNYDPKSAKNFDNGVFWIDYDSLCRFFDVIYMNWNPSLFKHSYGVHASWKAGVGPAKDMFDISNNPQYSFELAPGSGAVWILLSRHITDIEDFRNNNEYITVMVYKSDGRKVYYPFDPPPYIDGVRINSPHYLCQMVIKDATPRKLTLVVSQYEKSTTIDFTLRVYSTLSFSLKKIGDPYKYRQEINTAKWERETAGGCANYPDTYQRNPRFQFTTNSDCRALVELKAPKQFHIGFDIVCVVAGDKKSPLYFRKKSSEPYRSGFVVMPVDLTAGTYDIVPTTFQPGKESAFFLTVKSNVPLKITRTQ